MIKALGLFAVALVVGLSANAADEDRKLAEHRRTAIAAFQSNPAVQREISQLQSKGFQAISGELNGIVLETTSGPFGVFKREILVAQGFQNTNPYYSSKTVMAIVSIDAYSQVGDVRLVTMNHIEALNQSVNSIRMPQRSKNVAGGICCSKLPTPTTGCFPAC